MALQSTACPGAEFFEALCEVAGFSPATGEDYARERARVKAEVIERLGAGADYHGDLRVAHRETTTNDEGADVDRLVYALMNYWSPGSVEVESYLDHQTGGGVFVCHDGGWDEREFPSENSRYERIESLAEAEVSLLTYEAIEDIADWFRRSRGFK